MLLQSGHTALDICLRRLPPAATRPSPGHDPDAEHADTITVHVKTLMGITHAIQPTPSASIGDLKIMIRNLQGTPPDQQRLIFKGKQLNDSRTLSEFGIKDGSSLHCLILHRGPSRHNRELLAVKVP